MKQPTTEEQALYRLSALCSKAEHCSGEMLAKMKLWGLDEEARARVLDKLQADKFVDDARYARAFVDDKLRYTGWGALKISQALRQKQVEGSIIDEALSEVTPQQWLDVLLPLLQQKWPSVSAATDYERSVKLIKFAYGRGFPIDLIRKAVDRLGLEEP